MFRTKVRVKHFNPVGTITPDGSVGALGVEVQFERFEGTGEAKVALFDESEIKKFKLGKVYYVEFVEAKEAKEE